MSVDECATEDELPVIQETREKIYWHIRDCETNGNILAALGSTIAFLDYAIAEVGARGVEEFMHSCSTLFFRYLVAFTDGMDEGEREDVMGCAVDISLEIFGKSATEAAVHRVKEEYSEIYDELDDEYAPSTILH